MAGILSVAQLGWFLTAYGTVGRP